MQVIELVAAGHEQQDELTARLTKLYGGDDGVLDQAERMMQKYDTNGDGEFSPDEVRAIIEDCKAEELKAEEMVKKMEADAKSSSQAKTFKCVGGFSALILYCFIGALIMQALERSTELEAAQEMHNAVNDLNQSLAQFEDQAVICEPSNMPNAARVHNETVDMIMALVDSPPDLENLNWNIASSVFFATTLVSTIGYGSFAATTTGGRAWTVLFSCMGIIYFAYCLTMTSERIITALNYLARKVQGSKDEQYHMRASTGLVALVIGTFTYVFVLASAAALTTDWFFTDALYFAFITFTTIGLGDFAPAADAQYGQAFNGFRFFMFSVVTLVGMGMVSAVIAETGDFIAHHMLVVRAKLKLEAKELLYAESEHDAALAKDVKEQARKLKELEKQQYIGDDVHYADTGLGILGHRAHKTADLIRPL